MKRLIWVFILVSLFWTQWVRAEEKLITIDKKYNFSIRQSQEYTFLYNKDVIITKWKNEWFSCDKEWGYGKGDLINAKVCISDELSLNNLWKNWYSFQILSKNYPTYYLYNTRSKSLYSYSAFDEVLQKNTWNSWLYYLFRSYSDFSDNNSTYEVVVQFKNDGVYEEIYKNMDSKSRLISYELLLNKKMRLKFQTNNKITYKIISIK